MKVIFLWSNDEAIPNRFSKNVINQLKITNQGHEYQKSPRYLKLKANSFGSLETIETEIPQLFGFSNKLDEIASQLRLLSIPYEIQVDGQKAFEKIMELECKVFELLKKKHIHR